MPLTIRGRVFATLTAARTAKAAIDALDPVPAVLNPDGTTAVPARELAPSFVVEHEEGTGPRDYQITNPGLAAERIRARGVRTVRNLAILRRADGGAWLLPEPRGRTLAGATRIRAAYDDATEVDRVEGPLLAAKL
jgi:hypothetical protein